MYYLKYLEKTDDNCEIRNLKKAIEYAAVYLKSENTIGYEFVNKMHEIILDEEMSLAILSFFFSVSLTSAVHISIRLRK